MHSRAAHLNQRSGRPWNGGVCLDRHGGHSRGRAGEKDPQERRGSSVTVSSHHFPASRNIFLQHQRTNFTTVSVQNFTTPLREQKSGNFLTWACMCMCISLYILKVVSPPLLSLSFFLSISSVLGDNLSSSYGHLSMQGFLTLREVKQSLLLPGLRPVGDSG